MLMWFLSFAENMKVFGVIMLIVSMVITVFVIGLRMARKVDSDDAETVLWVSIPTLLLSLTVMMFPSIEQVAGNQVIWNTALEVLNKKNETKSSKGDESNEEVPSMLKHSCNERVCR